MDGGLDQQLIGLQFPPMANIDEILVNLPAGFRARIGLNETSLTKALSRGEFTEAEKIIEEATDPEFLNDGALSATPLNIVLTGRSSFFHQSRNLKLAFLLMQKGANPNLRIPNHDLESASESPLEMLLRYYQRLTEVFGLPGSGQCRSSYRPTSFEETELMDTVGLNGEIGGLGPGQITGQVRQLLVYCLEHGGDCNLPTTDAAKTIFHMAMTGAVLDTELVTRMLELGANVNMADVHNTTPLMDIVSLGDQSRSLLSLETLVARSQTQVQLDIENCSRQSALWRAVYEGCDQVTGRLLTMGAGQVCSARVEPVVRPSPRKHTNIQTTVPAILSPLLSNSPCTANLHARLPRKRTGQPALMEFSVLATDHVTRHRIAPLVDSGQVTNDSVTSLVSSLITSQTDHSAAGDSSVVDSAAVIPLMLGQLTAGLRQLAVRTIMSHILFSCSPATANTRLDTICRTQEQLLTQLLVKPSLTSAQLARDTEQSLPCPMSVYPYLDISPQHPTELSRDTDTSSHRPTDMEMLELGSELEYSSDRGQVFNTSAPSAVSSDNDEYEEAVELAVSDIAVSDIAPSDDNEEMSLADMLDTIATIDRELEVIKTDLELDSIDRTLASWENELLQTMTRIERYHAELEAPNQCMESARRRSEDLIERLRLERENRELSQRLRRAKTALEISQDPTRCMQDSQFMRELEMQFMRQLERPSLSPDVGRILSLDDEDQSEVRVLPSTNQGTPRRWIDENWSLGSERVMTATHEDTEDDVGDEYEDSDVGSEMGDRAVEDVVTLVCDQCLGVAREGHLCPGQPSTMMPVVPAVVSSTLVVNSDSPSHTDTLVRTLTVTHNYDGDEEEDGGARMWQQYSRESETEEATARSSSETSRDEELTFRFPSHSFRSPPVPPPRLTASSSEDSDSSSVVSESEVSSYDSDTWGGTFSLRHTGKAVANNADTRTTGHADIVSRLTPRTLFALTDHLGIPHSLRPLFSIEAARLQLSLSLFCHRSITCDRNCEGDESESDDSEEDWLDTDTEDEEDITDEVNNEAGGVQDTPDEAPYLSDSESSSVSNFSARSWYGSLSQITEAGRQLSPVSTPTSSLRGSASWLDDREDLIRVRQFLETSPGPDFHHSTDSEDD